MPTIPESAERLANNIPPTDSAPTNLGLGALTVAATSWGSMNVTGGPEVVGIAAFLNLIAQVIKLPNWFDQNKWLVPVLFVIAIVVGYFVLFHGDLAKSFLNGSLGTLKALADYKADKVAGTNILKGA